MDEQNYTSSLNGTNDINCTNCTCDDIDDFRNMVYSTSYSIITVFGLFGNGLALLILLRTRRQSSPFHVYMTNLALSDLLCVMTLPLRVMYYARKGRWEEGDFLCRISSYFIYANLYCSIYFMTAMSFTRFLAIVYPVQNLNLVTTNRVRLVCVGIWIFSCLSTSPFLMSGQFKDEYGITKCFEPPRPASSRLPKLQLLNYVGLVFGFILPFLVILICSVGIVRTLLSRTPAARRQQAAGVRAIRMIVIVLLTFLLSFTPYHVQRTLHLLFLEQEKPRCDEQNAMQKSVVVTLSLAAANTCFDPLLYFFSGESFRNRLSSLRQTIKATSVKQSVRSKPMMSESGEINEPETE